MCVCTFISARSDESDGKRPGHTRHWECMRMRSHVSSIHTIHHHQKNSGRDDPSWCTDTGTKIDPSMKSNQLHPFIAQHNVWIGDCLLSRGKHCHILSKHWLTLSSLSPLSLSHSLFSLFLSFSLFFSHTFYRSCSIIFHIWLIPNEKLLLLLLLLLLLVLLLTSRPCLPSHWANCLFCVCVRVCATE